MGEDGTAFRRAVLLFWCLVVTAVILTLVFADTQDQGGSKINTLKRRRMQQRKLLKGRYNKRDSDEEEKHCNGYAQSCGLWSVECCSEFRCVKNTMGKEVCLTVPV